MVKANVARCPGATVPGTGTRSTPQVRFVSGFCATSSKKSFVDQMVVPVFVTTTDTAASRPAAREVGAVINPNAAPLIWEPTLTETAGEASPKFPAPTRSIRHSKL